MVISLVRHIPTLKGSVVCGIGIVGGGKKRITVIEINACVAGRPGGVTAGVDNKL